MPLQPLIDDYLAGPELLRKAVAGLTPAQLAARPVPGKWSTAEVVCHLADFEGVYAERMKRVIVESSPALASGDPTAFAARLAYGQRDVEEELALIALVRKQMGRILASLSAEDFQRQGLHSTDGPMSLETLLGRITRHIPHHVRFIEEKRRAL
jgi:hypothetical protein